MRLSAVSDSWSLLDDELLFHFEGRAYRGVRGDTVSAALWAAGVKVQARSFKYHRPRGILSFANHDANLLMQDGPQLNLRADVEPLRAGMMLTAVNTLGGVQRDRARWLDYLSGVLPVGFYYKAFHGRRLFPFWERQFRRLTGLGQLDFTTPRQRTAKRYDFADVLVVGGGLSGLSAALAAAQAGADVVLAEESVRLGGAAFYQRGGTQADQPALQAMIARVLAHPRIRVRCATLVAGAYADLWFALVDADKLTKLRAGSVIVATGAIEQPAVFRNNDLPGVMLASAAQRLIYRHAVRPMQRAVLLVGNRDGYRAALDLLAHGVVVVAVLDLRAAPPDSDARDALSARGIPLHDGHAIIAAHTGPDSAVAAVDIGPWHADLPLASTPAVTARLACDGVLVSTGWAPAANLLYQAGARLTYVATVAQFVPTGLPPGVFACGRVNGVFADSQKPRDGARAGLAAAAYLGRIPPAEVGIAPESESPSHPWPVVPHARGKNFVDFDEDLQLKDLLNAVREGYDNIELLKRFSTVGMGPSQGKHANMNALRILARVTGRTPGEIGTTTARPFVQPVAFSHLAGRGFEPFRQTPLHAWHAALGGCFMRAGAWLRPEYYARPGLDKAACVAAEVQAVRTRAGLIDVSTLGKIEIRGPQAAAFLERVFVSRYAGLKTGMTRYAVMCDESGVLIDDGVVARLGETRFYFTTTTSGAAAIYRELSRLNAIWQLDCGLVNLTGVMAAMNLAGPLAPRILQALCPPDLSADTLPYLAVREAELAGIPVRLLRVGFVGEWGVEIHVPCDRAAALWEALFEAGRRMGMLPFGVEAQRVLRLEKGHLIIGQDTDGLSTPFDAGLDWAVKLDKAFFVGQRSLRIHAARPARERLAGFEILPGFSGPPPQECHLVIADGEIAGRVTSIAWSDSLGRYIGLAFLRPLLAKVGQVLHIRRSDGSDLIAHVVETPFYDPANARQQVPAP